jgi:hypothetical protein
LQPIPHPPQPDPEAASEEVEAALLEGDRAALRQFNAALNARREMRALELVGGLHHARSIQGASRVWGRGGLGFFARTPFPRPLMYLAC